MVRWTKLPIIGMPGTECGRELRAAREENERLQTVTNSDEFPITEHGHSIARHKRFLRPLGRSGGFGRPRMVLRMRRLRDTAGWAYGLRPGHHRRVRRGTAEVQPVRTPDRGSYRVVRTRYGFAAWWRAVKWWWPRRRLLAAWIAVCSLPKAAYYELRGRRTIKRALTGEGERRDK